MIIYGAEPLKGVHASMLERGVEELQNHLTGIGASLDLDSADPNNGAIRLNLATHFRKESLFPLLDEWRVQRVDLEASDIPALMGVNVLSVGIARGLQSQIPAITNLLTAITPSEIFDRLDAAITAMVNDGAPIVGDEKQQAAFQRELDTATVIDLKQHGLIESAEDPWERFNRQNAERQTPRDPKIYPEFETTYRPYRGAFEDSF